MIYDFVVVGAGIVGASVAYELARSGRVCVLERESAPGFHATGRSAALFAPSYGGAEMRGFTRASKAFFEGPPDGFADQPLLRDRGCLYIARDDQRVRLRRMIEQIRRSGGGVTLISADEAMRRVPLLRPGYVASAALDSEAMDIDVNGLHRGYLRAARTAGAVLRTDVAPVGARFENGYWRLDLGDDVLCTRVVINAAGAWADEVATLFGARPVGLQPLRRTAVLVDPPADIDVRQWPTVMDVDEQFYFKPDAGKLLLSPADETPDRPSDAQPNEIDIAIGVDRVQSALCLEVRKVNHSWAGLRTFAPDRVPVVGFDPVLPGFFWSVGQGGYGIQSAPALARAISALARHQAFPDDIIAEGLVAETLSPRRFS